MAISSRPYRWLVLLGSTLQSCVSMQSRLSGKILAHALMNTIFQTPSGFSHMAHAWSDRYTTGMTIALSDRLAGACAKLLTQTILTARLFAPVKQSRRADGMRFPSPGKTLSHPCSRASRGRQLSTDRSGKTCWSSAASGS